MSPEQKSKVSQMQNEQFSYDWIIETVEKVNFYNFM